MDQEFHPLTKGVRGKSGLGARLIGDDEYGGYQALFGGRVAFCL